MGQALRKEDVVFETKKPTLELLKKQERVAHLGEIAIRANQLGTNDELTPIYNYLLNGEDAMTGIELDAKTKIAEYLKDTPFKSFVDFNFTGDDFISQKDKVSMKKMMQNTLDVLESEIKYQPSLQKELERAKIEKQEFEKIADWYELAPIGSYLIFESLPISKEKFAVSRIYQKAEKGELKSCFLSLFNSSVERFNYFRKTISPNLSDSEDELDMLSNCYIFEDKNLDSLNKFSEYYVDIYDKSLNSNDKKYNFGLEINGTKKIQNGIEKIEKSSKFVSIYVDAIREIAKSNGRVTDKIINIHKNLAINNNLRLNQAITPEMAAKIMEDVIKKIACAIDLGDEEVLQQIENCDEDSDKIIYSTFESTGSQASLTGNTYESNGCSKIDRSESNQTENDSASETDILKEAYRSKQDKIGRLHMGVCRIDGCPSHQISKENTQKKRTIVGGCEVCMGCQDLFDHNKDPVRIYRSAKEQQEWTEFFEAILKRSDSNMKNTAENTT